MTFADVLRAFWVELTTPDNFRNEPYVALTNQIGHMGLGLVAACLCACLWFMAFGEMPVRLYMGIALSLVYLGFELGVQGYKGNDTFYDWAFVTIGIALPYLSLTEIAFSGGYSTLRLNIEQMTYGLIAALSLLVVYVTPRVIRKYSRQ